jgi:hypothetical protein
MSAIDNTPVNKNFLSPLNFTFILKRSPSLNFFVQKINLPGISLNAINTDSPLLRIPYGGDHIEYENLSVTFKVDEDFQNYLEIHNWIRGLGYPVDQTEYAALTNVNISSGLGTKSDIAIVIANGLKNANIEISFKDAFPIDLSELVFEVTDTDVNYVTATATFSYVYFDIIKL